MLAKATNAGKQLASNCMLRGPHKRKHCGKTDDREAVKNTLFQAIRFEFRRSEHRHATIGSDASRLRSAGGDGDTLFTALLAFGGVVCIALFALIVLCHHGVLLDWICRIRNVLKPGQSPKTKPLMQADL